MLRTVAELLDAIAQAERHSFERFPEIKHPTVIGDQHEALGRQLASLALPPAHTFSVVRGFVRSARGLSKQMDCMVVVGAGERVPQTDYWIYPLERVVALIEFKKAVFGKDLEDALLLFRHFWQEVAEATPTRANLLRDAWRAMHRSELPSTDEEARLSERDLMFLRALRVEAIMPPRVVFGFDGYATEDGLRRGFLKQVKELNQSQETAVGPVALPSLVISRESSLVKLNGMPFPGRFDRNTRTWDFYATRAERPYDALLEVLWCRLNYYWGAESSSLFGEDLEEEAVNVLLRATGAEDGRGWHVDAVMARPEVLAQGDRTREWMPSVLSEASWTVLNRLCNGEEVAADDAMIAGLAEERGGVGGVAAELRSSGLAYSDGKTFRLLTDGCVCGVDPELGFIAGEDKSGRLTRWTEKRLRERKKPPS